MEGGRERERERERGQEGARENRRGGYIQTPPHIYTYISYTYIYIYIYIYIYSHIYIYIYTHIYYRPASPHQGNSLSSSALLLFTLDAISQNGEISSQNTKHMTERFPALIHHGGNQNLCTLRTWLILCVWKRDSLHISIFMCVCVSLFSFSV